jgi:hypothetical protein
LYYKYVNAKMIPAENIPGMGVAIKENGELKYDKFDTL